MRGVGGGEGLVSAQIGVVTAWDCKASLVGKEARDRAGLADGGTAGLEAERLGWSAVVLQTAGCEKWIDAGDVSGAGDGAGRRGLEEAVAGRDFPRVIGTFGRGVSAEEGACNRYRPGAGLIGSAAGNGRVAGRVDGAVVGDCDIVDRECAAADENAAAECVAGVARRAVGACGAGEAVMAVRATRARRPPTLAGL